MNCEHAVHEVFTQNMLWKTSLQSYKTNDLLLWLMFYSTSGMQ